MELLESKVPFALLIIGLVLMISAVRGTHDQLFGLVKSDFTGPNNFVFWTVAIILIGSIGYIPKLKPLSVGFLTLVVLVLVLKRGDPNSSTGGFFQKFTEQIASTTTVSAPVAAASTSSSTSNFGDLSNMLNNLEGSLSNLIQ